MLYQMIALLFVSLLYSMGQIVRSFICICLSLSDLDLSCCHNFYWIMINLCTIIWVEKIRSSLLGVKVQSSLPFADTGSCVE